MRRWFILTCATVAAAATLFAATGYVVILKNGKVIRASKALVIEGDQALISLPTGVLASYDVNKIDLVETERYNKLGLGNALLIEELTHEEAPQPTPTPHRSLGYYTSIASQPGVLGAAAEPTPTPTPGVSLKAYKYRNARVDRAFSQIFDDRKLYVYRTSAGSKPSYLFVQAVTDREREVFTTLRIVAEAYAAIHKLHPRIAPAAVELEMVNTTGNPAGMFRITPEMARTLSSGAVTVEQFYINHVIF